MSGMYKPGEHDLSTQQIVATRLASLIETGNPLVFDMTQATFIDSTVVNAVMRARSALAARECQSRWSCPTRRLGDYRS